MRSRSDGSSPTPAPRSSLYVRHSSEQQTGRGARAGRRRGLARRGCELASPSDLPRHVVLNASTGEGLSALAVARAPTSWPSDRMPDPSGRLQPGTSAQRMLEGGPVAVAITLRGARARGPEGRVVAPSARSAMAVRTNRSVARRAPGGGLAPKADPGVDLLVVGSQPLPAAGRVAVTAAGSTFSRPPAPRCWSSARHDPRFSRGPGVEARPGIFGRASKAVPADRLAESADELAEGSRSSDPGDR